MRAVETADGALVERSQGGEAAAYEDLYRRHREAVARTIYLVVRDLDAAQDLTQEAFTVGWRDIGRLRDPARFRAWVTGIGLNLARRRWRRREVPIGAIVRSSEPAEPDERLSIGTALRRLPIAQRAVIVLRFYVDLDEAEIARTLGIPVGTVKSRLSRARRRLAAGLEMEVHDE